VTQIWPRSGPKVVQKWPKSGPKADSKNDPKIHEMQ
jgi:hypothetical protein